MLTACSNRTQSVRKVHAICKSNSVKYEYNMLGELHLPLIDIYMLVDKQELFLQENGPEQQSLANTCIKIRILVKAFLNHMVHNQNL